MHVVAIVDGVRDGWHLVGAVCGVVAGRPRVVAGAVDRVAVRCRIAALVGHAAHVVGCL